jgi:hypothetical protein
MHGEVSGIPKNCYRRGFSGEWEMDSLLIYGVINGFHNRLLILFNLRSTYWMDRPK